LKISGTKYEKLGINYKMWEKLNIRGPDSSMMIAKCDEKGRLYIPKKLQSKISSEMFIIELKEGLLLVPVPEDPLKELQLIGQSLPDKSIAEFKSIIEQEALEEVLKKRD
jgi:DNA-binding transcriptional regulator/RsmH inhibitor MraZ